MLLADIEKPTTVLALLAGAAASSVGALLTFGVLVENWMMPGCDVGNPDRVAAICDVNADDYVRASPYAAVTLVAALLTMLLCWRVLRHARKSEGPSRSVRIQVGFAVTLPVVAVVGLLATAVALAFEV